MPTLVLRDGQSADIGFLLASGKEPLLGGPSSRDVVLMKLPLPSTSPLAAFIAAHRHVEFQASVVSVAETNTVSFTISPGQVFKAEVASSGQGSWAVTSIGGGTCLLLPK